MHHLRSQSPSRMSAMISLTSSMSSHTTSTIFAGPSPLLCSFGAGEIFSLSNGEASDSSSPSPSRDHVLSLAPVMHMARPNRVCDSAVLEQAKDGAIVSLSATAATPREGALYFLRAAAFRANLRRRIRCIVTSFRGGIEAKWPFSEASALLVTMFWWDRQT